jgi:segregation and condensation protein A
MAETTEFQPDPERLPQAAEGALIVDLDGFEGPLDVLLNLARDQKVDLRRISILALAEQYLAFINEARRLHLEIAADYLVMAAWLAYLKSRLLVPEPEVNEEEPSGLELAARLAFRLRQLEAMRRAAQQLFARDRVGQTLFRRGKPEGVRIIRKSIYDCTMLDLLRAYGQFKSSKGATEALPMRMARRRIISIEEALERLHRIVGNVPEWTVLQSFLPTDLNDEFATRSAMASHFTASLEMAKQGKVELRQLQPFGPLFLRRASRQDTEAAPADKAPGDQE